MHTTDSDRNSSGQLALHEYLIQELIGPRWGDQEVIEESVPPRKHYTTGILFPRDLQPGQAMTESAVDDGGTSIGDEDSDDPVSFANQFFPSSIGLSCALDSHHPVQVRVAAAVYEQCSDDPTGWHRRSLVADRPYQQVTLSPESPEAEVLEGHAKVSGYWRHNILTITLSNQTMVADEEQKAYQGLFQVELEIHNPSGTFRQYPAPPSALQDPDEAELQLLYRNFPVLAIGHGCSPDWSSNHRCVRAQWIPLHAVPAMTTSFQHQTEPGQLDPLRLAWLSDRAVNPQELSIGLLMLVQNYRKWIDKQSSFAVPSAFSTARNQVLKKLRQTADRIEDGIDLLSKDPDLLQAFRLANETILQTQYRPSISSRACGQLGLLPPQALRQQDFSWRPFQLGFILSSLRGLADKNSPDRQQVDLLCFPTGGGKTEAYLGLAALEIFRRRLLFDTHGAGTTVITRYTLRLLTSQQFNRTCWLTCACELIRRRQPDLLGEIPISIGLWVGQSVSPNRFGDAKEKMDQLVKDSDSDNNPFQVSDCNWCGTSLLTRNDDKRPAGIQATRDSFSFNCPNQNCPFHDALPVNVIDDHLYQNPPTILMATVDKFAQMPLEAGVGAFFGHSGRYLPPSLIIQDELHLLTGPLGTIFGLYEAAIDTVASASGPPPKVIAATATSRAADYQCQRLFGRSVKIFPPPGINADDSFFSSWDDTRPGNVYCGVMPAGISPSTAFIRLASAMLQAPNELDLSSHETDSYGTIIAYHNSLRELGNVLLYAMSDIPERLPNLASTKEQVRQLHSNKILELTSNRDSTQLPRDLERLEKPWQDPDGVILCVCTNMFSVGVDVKRLATMIVNGQPRMASEYIQATNRVGRDRVPGFTPVLFNASKARDRSHYETFRAFHQKLYHWVEPATVTPFSVPAMERAMPAALAAVVRHGSNLTHNEGALDFDPELSNLQKLLDDFRHRCRQTTADPVKQERIDRKIDQLVEEWQSHVNQSRPNALRYFDWSPGRQHNYLLVTFERQLGFRHAWPVMTSLRNVDQEAVIIPNRGGK